ncbi:MAG: hypothetical protein R3A47_08640 [Polyangiales bacterium]
MTRIFYLVLRKGVADPQPAAAPVDPDLNDGKASDSRNGRPNAWVQVYEWILDQLSAPLEELGLLSRMLWQTMFWAVRPPFRGRQLLSAMEFIGVSSILSFRLRLFCRRRARASACRRIS